MDANLTGFAPHHRKVAVTTDRVLQVIAGDRGAQWWVTLWYRTSESTVHLDGDVEGNLHSQSSPTTGGSLPSSIPHDENRPKRPEEAIVLAYDFPLLSLTWAMFWFFVMFSVFFAVIWAFIDNFRRRDYGGWAKAGWALVILVLPLLGTLIYMGTRPSDALDPL